MNLIKIGVYNNTIEKIKDGTLDFSETLGINEINQFVMYQNILNDMTMIIAYLIKKYILPNRK